MPAARTRSRADDGRVKPRSDVYVGLLGFSLLALTAAILFAFLNYRTIAEKPKPVQVAPAGGGAARPTPAPGGIANPGAAPTAQPPVGGGQPQPGGQQPPGNQPPQKK